MFLHWINCKILFRRTRRVPNIVGKRVSYFSNLWSYHGYCVLLTHHKPIMYSLLKFACNIQCQNSVSKFLMFCYIQMPHPAMYTEWLFNCLLLCNINGLLGNRVYADFPNCKTFPHILKLCSKTSPLTSPLKAMKYQDTLLAPKAIQTSSKLHFLFGSLECDIANQLLTFFQAKKPCGFWEDAYAKVWIDYCSSALCPFNEKF